MLSEELLKKVKRIEIQTRRQVDEMTSGQYKSHFRGQGIQFSDHRLYVPGDDVRHMDWKVSARTRDPMVKKFEEERERTVLLVVDVSGSKKFGTRNKLKSEAAAEVSAMVAYAASKSGDKVGLILFSEEVEKIIPPKRGRSQLLRIVSDVLTYQPKKQGTNIGGALDTAHRVLKHKGIVFVVSDFLDVNFEMSLKRLSRKHETVLFDLADPSESVIGFGGMFLVSHPETGAETWVDAGSFSFRQWIASESKKRSDALSQTSKQAGAERVSLSTEEDYGEAVVQFFQTRSRRTSLRAR